MIKKDIINENEKEKLTEISLMKYVKLKYFLNYNFFTQKKNIFNN